MQGLPALTEDAHEQQDDTRPEGGGEDGHKLTQSTSVTLQGTDDSQQSTQSTSITPQGTDDSHQSTQSTSNTLQGWVDGHQSTQSTSVTLQGTDGGQQASSPICRVPPEPPPSSLEPPLARDRGYAWVVVWAVFSVNIFTSGYIKSFGILYVLLIQYFPDASAVKVSWIAGLLLGTRSILSPCAGALTVKIGSRGCCLLGTAVLTLGLLLAVPTFSVYYMAFTLGGLVGLGINLSETPCYLLLNDYFLENRSTANGFRASGNPAGGLVFPPLLVFLNEHYGLQGTLIMLAGVMLHLAIFCALMRPFEQQQYRTLRQHTRTTTQPEPGTSTTTYGSGVIHTHTKEHPIKKKALDFTLFKNTQYLVYLALALSINLALPNFLIYIPPYAKSVGLTNYQASVVTSYISGAKLVFCVLCGCVTNKFTLNRVHILAVGFGVGGVGCVLVPLCSTVWQMVLATTPFAFSSAAFWTILNVLLADQFGDESTASTWGFFRMTQGIFSFMYPSLLGLIKDVTGGYAVPFYVMGSSFFLGSAIMLLQPLAAKLSVERAKRELSSRPPL